METYTKNITPLLAKELLNRTTTLNRNVKRDMVRHYAKLMLKGQFHETHQGIALDHKNNVIDGQHRLHAVIKAGETNPGIAVPLRVTTGCDPKSFQFIDSGAIRTHGDVLQADGCTSYGHTIAALLKRYYLYKNVPDEPWGRYTRRNGLEANAEEICKLRQEKLYELNSLLPVIKSSHHGFPHFGVAAGTCFSLIAMDQGWKVGELEDFWAIIKTGANLESNSPLLSFRNQLSNAGKWQVKGTGMQKEQLLINNFIKAFNTHVSKQKVNRFFIVQAPPQGEMLKVVKRSKIIRPDILSIDDEERGLA